jgi:hypothetical protein
VGKLIALVERYPVLVDAAFIIIAWIGGKLCLDYLHSAGYVAFEIPHWLSLVLIVGIFTSALVYARRLGPVAPVVQVEARGVTESLRGHAERILAEESGVVRDSSDVPRA